MAPTQANRLDTLEEELAAIQGEIPDLKESMEAKFGDLKKCFEEVVSEQNRKMDECTKGQKEITAALSIFMVEMKAMNTRIDGRDKESPPNHASSNRERSEVEQMHQKGADHFNHWEE